MKSLADFLKRGTWVRKHKHNTGLYACIVTVSSTGNTENEEQFNGKMMSV
jgi:hypothetical protein